MKVEVKDTFVIFKDTQKESKAFADRILHEYNSYINKNFILDVTHNKDFAISDLKFFDPIIKNQKVNKKSILFVSEDIDFNKIPIKYNVVPSVQEAHDIIEMDEIERDLGF